jgi:hypothetical protein
MASLDILQSYPMPPVHGRGLCFTGPPSFLRDFVLLR